MTAALTASGHAVIAGGVPSGPLPRKRLGVVVWIAIAWLVGGLIGLLAGYYKRRVETITLFGADVLMAFPTLLLAASIVALTESRGLTTVVLVIALIYLGPTIRIVRAITLSVASRDFVLAAQSLGATNARVVRREIMPNVVPTLMAMMIIAVAGAVVAEGGLAYLNLSVAPPQPTWGSMIAAGKPKLDESLYPVLVPSSIDPSYDLTIHNAASAEPTLRVMTVIAVIGLPFVLLYTAGVYYFFRGRVVLDDGGY